MGTVVNLTVLGENNEAAVVLSAPDSIAWLLNIRGGDVPYTPVALAFAVLRADATVEVLGTQWWRSRL